MVCSDAAYGWSHAWQFVLEGLTVAGCGQPLNLSPVAQNGFPGSDRKLLPPWDVTATTENRFETWNQRMWLPDQGDQICRKPFRLFIYGTKEKLPKDRKKFP